LELIPPQQVSSEGDSALFAPLEETGITGCAYALYTLNAMEMGSVLLESDWSEVVEGTELYIGWANFQEQRWDWVKRSPGQSMKIDVLAPYIEPYSETAWLVFLTSGSARLIGFTLTTLEEPAWKVVEVNGLTTSLRSYLAFGSSEHRSGSYKPVLLEADGHPVIIYSLTDWNGLDPKDGGVPTWLYCAFSETPGGASEHRWAAHLIDTFFASDLHDHRAALVGGRLACSVAISLPGTQDRSNVQYYYSNGPDESWFSSIVVHENSGDHINYSWVTQPVLVDGRPALLAGESPAEGSIFFHAQDELGNGPWDAVTHFDHAQQSTALLVLEGRPAFLQSQGAGSSWWLANSATPLSLGDWSSAPVLPGFWGIMRLLVASESKIYALDLNGNGHLLCGYRSTAGVGPWDSVDLFSLSQGAGQFMSMAIVGGQVLIAKTGHSSGSEAASSLNCFASSEPVGPDSFSQHQILERRFPADQPGEKPEVTYASMAEVDGRPAIAFTELTVMEDGYHHGARLYYAIYSHPKL
jgi:hypothetical protein